MSGTAASGVPDRSPARRAVIGRRAVKLLVLVDIVVVVAAVGVWLLARDGDDRANVVNEGLRGSLPPQGQVLPDLSDIAGIEPPFPTRDELAGRVVQLTSTCMECRSGDIVGGYLGRLVADDVPDDAQLRVIAWDGDAREWMRRSGVNKPDSALALPVHVATTPAAAAELRRVLGIGERNGSEESGITFLYDTRGRWRSTYFVGQLNRDDVRHDLEQLADDDTRAIQYDLTVR